MTTNHEDSFSDIENQLSSISIVEPSENFGDIVDQLKLDKPTPWWQNWTLVSSGALACMAIAAIVIVNPGNTRNPIPTDGTQTASTTNSISPAPDTIPTTAIQSQQVEPYIAGTHYFELATTVPPIELGVTEVVAFFWYPCDPCHEFNDYLQDWETTENPDVRITEIPAIWSDAMRLHARAYYTAQTLGVLSLAHNRLYIAAQGNKEALNDQLLLTRVFSALGISAAEFRAAYNSEATLDSITQAEQANRDYQIQATPTLFVKGKYGITATTAGGYPEMLEVADYLLERF
jgi:thiol:disulfide interchange protein DsbA